MPESAVFKLLSLRSSKLVGITIGKHIEHILLLYLQCPVLKFSTLKPVIRTHDNAVAFYLKNLMIPGYIQRIEGSCIFKHPCIIIICTNGQIHTIFQGELLCISKHNIELPVHLIQYSSRVLNSLPDGNLPEELQAKE